MLKECQEAVVKAHGEEARFYLVFHGGSGSALSEIHEALRSVFLTTLIESTPSSVTAGRQGQRNAGSTGDYRRWLDHYRCVHRLGGRRDSERDRKRHYDPQLGPNGGQTIIRQTSPLSELPSHAVGVSIRIGLTADDIKQAFRDNLVCGMGRLEAVATKHDLYFTLALTVRGR